MTNKHTKISFLLEFTPEEDVNYEENKHQNSTYALNYFKDLLKDLNYSGAKILDSGVKKISRVQGSIVYEAIILVESFKKDIWNAAKVLGNLHRYIREKTNPKYDELLPTNRADIMKEKSLKIQTEKGIYNKYEAGFSKNGLTFWFFLMDASLETGVPKDYYFIKNHSILGWILTKIYNAAEKSSSKNSSKTE